MHSLEVKKQDSVAKAEESAGRGRSDRPGDVPTRLVH
jgi:hypothetical protein